MKKTVSLLIVTTLLFPSILLAQVEGTMVTQEAPNDTARPTPIPTEGRPMMVREGQGAIKQKIMMRNGIATSSRPLGVGTGTMREMMRGGLPNDGTRMKATGTRPLALQAKQNFCTEIDKVLTSIDTKAIKIEDKREVALNTRDAKRTSVRTEVDVRRDENESKRKAQLDELTRRATTEAQKQAIATFAAAMTSALLTKDVAIDAILLAHRTEVDTITTARKADISKAITALKTEIDAAKTKAKADCANQVAGDTVRSTLRTSIEKAQETFRTTVKSIEKVKDVSKESRDAKKEAVRMAEEAFKVTIKKAKDDLKLALTVTATASSTQ